MRWEQEPARAVAKESCESEAGPARVVLEAEGRQVVHPALPQRAPVHFSLAEFEQAMRLLVAQLPGPPQPLFHRPGKILAVYTSLSIYLGLLLLPEPTSKLIALGMTVTLVAYLGANTLFNVVEGYRQLQEAVRSARSLLELRSIGERYGRVLGEQVGRVLVLVATAALGWTAHGMMKGPGLPRRQNAAHYGWRTPARETAHRRDVHLGRRIPINFRMEEFK